MKTRLLLTVAVVICIGCYDQVRHAKERVLQEDLYTLRCSIDQFTQDQERAPETLDDLVTHGYLGRIPIDPFTKSQLTWQLVYRDSNHNPQDTPAVPPQEIQKLKGIIDVHSGSDQTSWDGTRYKDW